MSSGYAKGVDKAVAMPGPYKVVGEALEIFAAVLTGVLHPKDHGEFNYQFTADGRKYHSSMVRVPRRREREPVDVAAGSAHPLPQARPGSRPAEVGGGAWRGRCARRANRRPPDSHLS
jgi:hypothetical protein